MLTNVDLQNCSEFRRVATITESAEKAPPRTPQNHREMLTNVNLQSCANTSQSGVKGGEPADDVAASGVNGQSSRMTRTILARHHGVLPILRRNRSRVLAFLFFVAVSFVA